MRVIGVIPARFQSSRLEGKPLADILGRPMVQHVYERALQAKNLDDILVATDDHRIHCAVNAFGGKAVMTSPNHRSGTDRVVVNIQGDEPMLDPRMLEEVVTPFRNGTAAGLVTLKKEVFHESEFADPGVVKVVTDPRGMALYFSRSLIPFPRHRTRHFRVFEHVGVYAYTRECLQRLTALPVSPLKEIESLEQLRALENGIPILVVESGSRMQTISVDTQADLERVREAMRGLPV